jgi:hypothetical protein
MFNRFLSTEVGLTWMANQLAAWDTNARQGFEDLCDKFERDIRPRCEEGHMYPSHAYHWPPCISPWRLFWSALWQASICPVQASPAATLHEPQGRRLGAFK